MASNQAERSRLEQRSLINCLLAEKGKWYKIYRIFCDMYGDVCFTKNVLKLFNEGRKDIQAHSLGHMVDSVYVLILVELQWRTFLKNQMFILSHKIVLDELAFSKFSCRWVSPGQLKAS